MSYLIVIPARLASSRLPEKVLQPLSGRTLLEHVWQAASRSRARQVVVATDDSRIEDVVRSFGGEVLMTREDHVSGSDRIAEVVDRLDLADDQVVVNLQGDEPEMPPTCLDQVADLLLEGGDVATLYWPIDEPDEVTDPNAVKVVANGQGDALYFSRAAIPHRRDSDGAEAALDAGVPYRRHLGLYAYRAGALRRFTAAEPSALEQAEGLEQLRFLDLGMRIRLAAAREKIPPGIDTPADLEQARQRLGS